MKFIVDTQLPPRLAKSLVDKGFDAIHTTYFTDGHLLDDESIRQIAISKDRIIISKDSDFFDSFLIRGAPPRVLLLRFGNITNKNLIALFEAQLPLIEQLFDKDETTLVEFFADKLVRF